MKRIQIIPFLLLQFFSLLSTAQSPGETPGTLPSIIPPSPDVAAITKIGATNTNLHTGAASVNIPLYELSVGSLKVPVSLSYSTNGTKTNDIASRVGLGWNLIAGGSINRIIHDEEDGDPNAVSLTPPDFTQYNQTLMDYLFYANLELYDTEKDEYSFSVNGISGKFFFDANGNIQVSDHSNIKITKEDNSFTLIAGDGTKYEFGKNGEIEKTKDVKTNGTPRAYKIKTTAWFITRIISPEKDTVKFFYKHLELMKTQLGPNQSVIFKTLSPGYPTGEPFTSYPEDCKPKCNGQWSSYQFSKVDYDTYYLDYIKTTNGQFVYFVYENRPDNSLDTRVTSVFVQSDNTYSPSKLIRKYLFEYDDPAIPGTTYDINKRFFLKKIYTESTGTENPPTTLVHQFEYNDPSTLGSQESLLQDYYGYSKGNGNQPANFIPLPPDYQNYEDGFLGADRSPNFNTTKAGTIKKVIYPTGGHEEFFYEPHTLLEYFTDSVFQDYKALSGPGTAYNSILTYTKQFTPASAPIRISYTTEWNPLGPAPGSQNYWTPDGIHFLSYLEIWKVSTNERVFEARHRNYQGDNIFPHLQAGILYEIRLKVAGESHAAYVNIQYNPVVQITSANTPACGLRVRKIEAFDPVTNSINKKFFTYAAMDSISKTSGIGQLRPTFEAVYKGGGVCFDLTPPYVAGEKLAECPGGLLQVSSSSLSGFYTFNGSPVAYTHVIESDDSTFLNGAVEHQYYTVHSPVPPMVVLGNEIASASSAGCFPDFNGTETKTTWFKKKNTAIFPIKQVRNVYKLDNRVSATLTNYIVRKRWNPPTESHWSYTDKLKGYDVGSYIYLTSWRVLDSSISIAWDDEGLNPTTDIVTYQYANTVHTLATTINTTNSKNEAVVQTQKYPHDYSVAPYTSMVSANIIVPVIEQSTSIAGSPISTVKTEYVNPPGTGFFKPSKVLISKGSAAPEERLHYHSYDDFGNLLQVSKDEGMNKSYIWNYQNSFPVAEISNAAVYDVSYTSFETDEDGSWYRSQNDIHPYGITGSTSLSGSVSRELNSSLTYIITAWSKGMPTANSVAGTLLTSKRGWNLYQWKISNASFVDVKGHIDEVRLYPEGAQISTYTYFPSIGIATVSDLNNKILYYEYDGLNRLLRIRDIDSNIVKQYDYKYNQSIAPCSNPTASWVITGRTQCVMSSNNNYTGEQLKEERDQNNCSPTYLQARWVSIGVTGQCEPIPNCTGAGKRVINGTCQTGTKVLISSLWTGTTWQCTYKYVWSDDFESQPFIEYNTNGCIGQIEW